MANRLAAETSPYLLQHADNPVDWYPWGEEALGRARAEDLPILLSVGYSACHWCHVMERESFEDADTAAFMNANFVCIKVDREERPDVDAIYMEAVQAFTGQGGWPMTVFLDPEGVPFYGGTYFPPDDSRGMPSFRMVMEAVLEAYRGQRDEIRERAATMVGRLEALAKIDPGEVARPGAAGGGGDDAALARRPGQRRLRPRAEVPARVLAGADPAREPRREGRPRARRAHPRRDAGRRHLRPGRRRLRPLRGRLGLARPPLREDALRQRPARPRLPARLAGPRARALPAGLRGDARLAAARDARARGRLLLGLRRRLGGRGGQVLRLDAGRDPRGAGEAAAVEPGRTPSAARPLDRGDPRLLRRHRGGQLRGQEHPPPRRRRRGARARRPRRGPRRAARRPRRAGPARPRRQAPLLLERAGDRGARRGGRGARPRRLPRGGRRPAPSSSSARCATRTAASCAPTRTAAPT